MCSLTGVDPKGHFKFEKDSDGTFSIYSKSNAKYLQIQPSSCTSTATVGFLANADQKSKFTLIFHQQQDKHQSGILIDIYSLENGCFLSTEVIQHTEIVRSRRGRYTGEVIKKQTQLVANSITAPANKFDPRRGCGMMWDDQKQKSDDCLNQL